ncbi:MmcQ/YjbR family DNA-binding protein [Dongia mobilis]|jgi:predicted DNA-binding protein (MmcQ/YjbR family)|uniref:MmcQ/YjbR family DNA-binding protein n=1 Tax=Dongia sp. TaxID=1977262 RepID=UPI0026EA5C6B
MTRAEFDKFCKSLPKTSHVEQWGGASVWKIGGKIFAICSNWGQGGDTTTKISFKCSDMSYDLLRQQKGIVPAPYLARAKWVQIEQAKALSDKDLRAYIETAYRLVAGKLTKAKRAELGLLALAQRP